MAETERSSLILATVGGDSRKSFPSLRTILQDGYVLKNEGSTARDHLANERTYLAWMRTALALVGASLALLKWDGSAHADAIGYIVAVVALAMMAASTDRYFTNMRHLERGEFRPNTRGIIFIVLVVLCAIASAFILHFRDGL